jgi:hypothetical protein
MSHQHILNEYQLLKNIKSIESLKIITWKAPPNIYYYYLFIQIKKKKIKRLGASVGHAVNF